MPSEREKMRMVADAASTDQVPEPILRCNQMYVEAFLLDASAALPRVELRLAGRCCDFTEHGDGVDGRDRGGRHRAAADPDARAISSAATAARASCGASSASAIGGERPREQAYLGGPMVCHAFARADFYGA